MPTITLPMKTTSINPARPSAAHIMTARAAAGNEAPTGTPPPGVPRVGVGILLFAVLALVGVMAAPTARADSPDKTVGGVQLMCPVTTDKKIDPEVSLQYQGQTVYFCCQKCRIKFEHSPEKYTASIVTVSGPPGLASLASNDRDHHPHGDDDDSASEVLERIGNFHVLVIHFPIALLVTAAFVRCLMLFGWLPWAGPAVRLGVLLGGVSAVVSAGLGWLHAGNPASDEWFGDLLFNHRWLGVATAIVSVILIVLVEKEVRKPSKTLGLWVTLGLLVAAGLVAATGHFGGLMVFGPDELPW